MRFIPVFAALLLCLFEVRPAVSRALDPVNEVFNRSPEDGKVFIRSPLDDYEADELEEYDMGDDEVAKRSPEDGKVFIRSPLDDYEEDQLEEYDMGD
ncbi:hypothetical protein C8R44DRAFT_876290 [Mycena epipterygia]|nr:hypothetical protein C8R44DRAFT_876290 [Mycena epipterygia]